MLLLRRMLSPAATADPIPLTPARGAAVAVAAVPAFVLGAGSPAWNRGVVPSLIILAALVALAGLTLVLTHRQPLAALAAVVVTAFGTGVQERLVGGSAGPGTLVPMAALAAGAWAGIMTVRLLGLGSVRRCHRWAVVLGVLGVALRLVPALSGSARSGALAIGGFSVHLGEVSRVLVAVSVAGLLVGSEQVTVATRLGQIRWDQAVKRLAVAAFPSLVVLGSLVWMKDLGPAVVLAVTVAAVLYRAGGPALAAVPLGTALVGGLLVGRGSADLRSRWQDVLDPQGHGAEQLGIALRAEGLAGVVGAGPGSGNLVGSIPVRFSDYLPAVVVADHGFVVLLAVLVLLAATCVGLLRQAARLYPDSRPGLLLTAAGVVLLMPTLWTGTANLGLVPLTGLDVPFLAANGSSTLAAGLALGVCAGAAALVAGSPSRPATAPQSGRHVQLVSVAVVSLAMVACTLQAVRLTVTAGGGRLAGETHFRPAGALLTRDGDVMAKESPAEGPRGYPAGVRYLDLGWRQPGVNSHGVERVAAGLLTCGDHHGFVGRALRFGLVEECEPATVVSTVDSRLQRVLVEEAGGNGRTTVMVVDATTGDVLGAASDLGAAGQPSGQPAGDGAPATGVTVRKTVLPPAGLLQMHPFTHAMAPGSTFKLVTALAAARQGVSPGALGDAYEPERGTVIRNAWNGDCPGTSLEVMIAYSCNTTAAWAAVAVGGGRLLTAAQQVGVGESRAVLGPADPSASEPEISWDLPASTTDLLGAGRDGAASLARTGIGQEGVRMSALDVALMTAGVVRGQRVEPRLVAGVCDGDAFTPIAAPRRTGTAEARDGADAKAFEVVRRGMRLAVSEGTARPLAGVLPASRLAAKTGTAETSISGTPAVISWITVVLDNRYVLTVAVEPMPDRATPSQGARAVDVAARILPALAKVTAAAPAGACAGR